MLWAHVDDPEVKPRVYLNSFPKAGLHLLALMFTPVLGAMPRTYFNDSAWVGTFAYNAWSARWLPQERTLYKLALLRPGCYYKGHSGYTPEVDTTLYYAGISQIFIYRDLRDVAVSQAYHITSKDDVRFKHPAKAAYWALGGFDEILSAVIAGLGAFPGVMERWELYAPWLEREWVLSVRYEDIMADKAAAARQMLKYAIDRFTTIFPSNWYVDEGMFDKATLEMAEMGGQTQLSPTFRKGDSGGWREAFTDEHKQLFKAHDVDGWLIKLGYAADDEW